MRTKKSMINAAISIQLYITSILIGFVTQKIFISYLGIEYLGLNSLFLSIISVLSIIELGFGSAIIYNLYKPISVNDKEVVKSLINYYKRIYRKIAIAVLICGLCILPFLNTIIGDTSIGENIHFIFFLFLMDTVASYLLTYKRSIFYADQKTYVINIIHIFYLVIMNGIQIYILIEYKNYIAYLVIKLVFRISENIVITLLANYKYPYLKEKYIMPLDDLIRINMIKNVKGLFFHQIGSAVVRGTDNIIISMTKSLGIVSVGLYSNYAMVFTSITGLFSQIFSSITASIGNLLIEDNINKSYGLFKKMLLFNSWIFTFVATSLLCIIEPFITLWVGENYILPKLVLIVIVINFYLTGMRLSYSAFKNAAGIFYEDRYVPIVEALLNIIFSLIFVKFYGLAGVFMGTVVSSFALFLYSYPKYVYGMIFKLSYKQCITDYFKYVSITFLSIIPTFIITDFSKFNNIWLQLVSNAFFCLIIPNLVYYLFFRHTEEYQYCKKLVLGTLRKIINAKDRQIG